MYIKHVAKLEEVSKKGKFYLQIHFGGVKAFLLCKSYRLRIFLGGGTMQYFSFVYVPDIDAWELGIIELINNIVMLSHP